MLDENILYLERKNRSTDIIYINHIKSVDDILPTVLDELCIKYLSTLKGRQLATKQILHIRKNVPVYVNDKLILQPLYSDRDWKQIYINTQKVKRIVEVSNGTTIVFENDKELSTELSLKQLNKLIEKSELIKDYIINIREEIYYYGKNEY